MLNYCNYGLMFVGWTSTTILLVETIQWIEDGEDAFRLCRNLLIALYLLWFSVDSEKPAALSCGAW